MKKIDELLKLPEYSFIKNNPHLGKNIIFLTLGGSHAYGTNVEGSDVDIRGCTLNSKSDILGFSNFEQFTEDKTDTKVYGFNRLITLLMDCNPNVIELLGCKPESYSLTTSIGQQLIDNRKIFLSKKAINSFGGYATAQLRRLENALARDTPSENEKERHILHSIKFAMNKFKERYQKFDNNSIELFISKSQKENIDNEIFMNVDLSHYPLRDYKGLWSEMNSIVKEYGKLNHRNNKKDDLHLNKHAMHIIRLYLMGLDILEKEEIITYREAEHDLLMSIRLGAFQNPDHTFKSEFFDMMNEYEKRFKYAANNTSLPDKPPHKEIENFVMSVNRKVVLDEY